MDSNNAWRGDVQFVYARQLSFLLPLPKGEGRGEGDSSKHSQAMKRFKRSLTLPSPTRGEGKKAEPRVRIDAPC
jgi:hypothetical protein